MIRSRPSFRRVLYPIAIVVGLAILIWVNRSDLPLAGQSVRNAKPKWIALGAIGSLMMIVNSAGLHRSTQSLVGIRRGWKKSIGLAYGIYFLNQIAKSGGMAGASLMVTEAKREGVSAGAATAGYVIATVVNQLGFSVALTVGLVVAGHQHELTRIDWIAASVFALLTAAFVTSLCAATRSGGATRRVFRLPWAAMRFLSGLVLRVHAPAPAPAPAGLKPTLSDQRADDFFATIQRIKQTPKQVFIPVGHALLAECIGVGVLWASMTAVGINRNIAVPIVGYTISILFSIVGFLPGGLGIVELSLASALISMGLTVGKAAAVVAIFRLFELWLPVTIGAICVSHFRFADSSR